MTESRSGAQQVFGIVVGIIVLSGVTALGGGAIGYNLGKADGQALAAAGSRVVQDRSGDSLPFLSGPGVPRIMPDEGQIPPEFAAPQAYLGVRFEPLDAELADKENLGATEGAIIREVIADSPAIKAGLKVGDVLTEINGEPVDAEYSLRDRVAAHKPNDTIELTVVRGSETLKINVTLGERKGIDVEGYQFRIPSDGEVPFFFGDPSLCLPRGEQG